MLDGRPAMDGDLSDVQIVADQGAPQDVFREAVLSGLAAPNKFIPCQFLYDEVGSQLFDRICDLPEYYPTRTEIGLLANHAAEIACEAGSGVQLVELGSGASVKVRLLLDALDRPSAYVPIDISTEHLAAAAARLKADYPALCITPISADYAQSFDLPERGAGRRLAFYPGSTIGNMSPPEARDFLALWARRLGGGAQMLIGVDLRKETAILERAYDDAQGVTAAFSLNLLARANRELGADFDPSAFRHEARYDATRGRVEIHLRALKDQRVNIAGRRFDFAAGERLHVEDSWKYDLDSFQRLAESAGYRTRKVWSDPDRLFSLHLLDVLAAD